MDLLDILNEINEKIYKETGDIRAEILQENNQDKIEKIHDYYAQIYLESENFMEELKEMNK